MRKEAGFTLIELLIVVAIIAILAAIAVPNFIEAQARAKIGRIQADLRVYATALETYMSDNNAYPPEIGNMNNPRSLIPLSTPVAYMANSQINDPFKTISESSNSYGMDEIRVYCYSDLWLGSARVQKFTRPDAFPLVNGRDLKTNNNARDPRGYKWMMIGYGPDGVLQADNDPAITQSGAAFNIYMPYDATNGTKGQGDIWRLGP